MKCLVTKRDPEHCRMLHCVKRVDAAAPAFGLLALRTGTTAVFQILCTTHDTL